MRGEDEPGQRMMIASSRDFIRWSAPQLLAEPSDGDYGTKKILTRAASGLRRQADCLLYGK